MGTSGCGDWTVQYQFSSIGPKIMEQRIFSCLIVMTLFCLVSTGTVKRDTLEEISGSIVNSVKDLVGLEEDNGIIEDLKIDEKRFKYWLFFNDPNLREAEKFCVADSQCRPEVLQYCHMTNKLYGTCTFYTWVWIALASVFAFVFCSCLTSLLCCCLGCCRKAT